MMQIRVLLLTLAACIALLLSNAEWSSLRRLLPDDAWPMVRPTVAATWAATWALPGEELKNGSGLLFFAYGGTAQIKTFLTEATLAAASFRKYNPYLAIAIVSNNASVDRTVFTHHIVPRADLLFPGSLSRSDQLPRQWSTRLLYMAQSPFAVTWALDSNDYHCPGPFAVNAVHRYLRAAEATSLWGFDIGHANMHRRKPNEPADMMSPHCFNIIWRWNDRTSTMFRDWFMLLLRRGIGADDQNPLRIAEARAIAASKGNFRVGQMPTEFAAAFYSASPPKFYPRISRQIRGPAYIVHGTPVVKRSTSGRSGPELCQAFNAKRDGTLRQLVQRDRKTTPVSVFEAPACRTALRMNDCEFQGGAMSTTADGSLLPTTIVRVQDFEWSY